MTQKEAKIKALEYLLENEYSYATLSNDSDLYTDSQFIKISNAIDDKINILSKKLEKLKLK